MPTTITKEKIAAAFKEVGLRVGAVLCQEEPPLSNKRIFELVGCAVLAGAVIVKSTTVEELTRELGSIFNEFEVPSTSATHHL